MGWISLVHPFERKLHKLLYMHDNNFQHCTDYTHNIFYIVLYFFIIFLPFFSLFFPTHFKKYYTRLNTTHNTINIMNAKKNSCATNLTFHANSCIRSIIIKYNKKKIIKHGLCMPQQVEYQLQQYEQMLRLESSSAENVWERAFIMAGRLLFTQKQQQHQQHQHRLTIYYYETKLANK